jgi:hypothetical protein
LVTYVVLRGGSAAAAFDADLLELFRAHLKALLPDYMVPVLPLIPNAKMKPGRAAGSGLGFAVGWF